MKVGTALSLALLMLMTTTLAGCVGNDAEVLDVFHGEDLPSDCLLYTSDAADE